MNNIKEKHTIALLGHDLHNLSCANGQLVGTVAAKVVQHLGSGFL
jgi:hypothetical protein